MAGDFLTGFKIASSGMSAQRARLNTIASNLANVNTTRTPEGGPYRRKDVVLQAMPEVDNFGEIVSATSPKADMQRVQVVDIVSDTRAPLLKYDPYHVDANEEGYVALPNINPVEEMTNMMQAQRIYEANVSAMQSAKDMALTSLEIGR